jgi:hypothetical protein
MRALLLALLLVLLACSAGAPPQAGPVTVAIAPPPPETAASALVAAAEPAPAPTVTGEAPRAPAIPDACRGAALDLDVLIEARDCDVRREAAPPPPPEAVAVELTAARSRIKPGETVDLTMAIVNKTAELLELDVPMSCGKEHQFEVEALNAKRERVDRTNTSCGFGTGCGLRTLHLAIAPGGRVHTKLTFKATAEKTDAQCAWKPAGMLKPGSYTLRVSTPLYDRDKVNAGEVHPRTAEAPITVAR